MFASKQGMAPAEPGSLVITNPTPDSNYAGTFTVPTGVFSLTITIVAGGGGGGGEQDGCTGGSGGGGGGWRTFTLPVTPFQTLSYVIGKRGLGGCYRSAATAGGDTTMGGYTAVGGGPGKSAAYEGGAGGYAGMPNGQAGTNAPAGNGGGCGPGNIYGVGGINTSVSSTGYGSGGGGTTGCYNTNCGGNCGCPGRPGEILISW